MIVWRGCFFQPWNPWSLARSCAAVGPIVLVHALSMLYAGRFRRINVF